MLLEMVPAVAAQIQAMPTGPVHHFYTDWTFWQGVVAFAALVLSQFRPLITYFRPGRLQVDLPGKVLVTHTFGNSNVNLLIGLRNVGAREVRVRSLWMRVKRTGADPFRLDAQHFENPGDTKAYFLVPFTIWPRENWVRHYMFYRDFERGTDKEISGNRLAVSRQIRERRANLVPGSPSIVEVDEALWTPFKTLFERQFQWLAGEYEVELHVDTEPATASLHKTIRFVLFEGDAEQLRDHVLEYKTGGGGIQWPGERALAVFPTITEVS